MDTYQYLHSTVVLLKESFFSPSQAPASLFTFYCSSIKGTQQANFIHHHPQFTFYSSSIKGLSTVSTLPSCVNLHSTVVLLKVYGSIQDRNRFPQFTFYCSSIKGMSSEILKAMKKGIYILL